MIFSNPKILVQLVIFFAPIVMFGQSSTEVVVKSINIVGNKKTKPGIILRECTFKSGDTISLEELDNTIVQSRHNIINSGLFNDVQINIKNWDFDNQSIILEIIVKETWYLFPIPIFELADRNFNVWWTDQQRSLKRVNLGLRLKYLNPTGNADNLQLVAQAGYTQKYQFDYFFPYINRKQTLGLSASLLYATNKEINYLTKQNKQIFYNQESTIFSRARTSIGLHYRPNIFAFHKIQLEYYQNTVDSIIPAEYNPFFFTSGSTSLKYAQLQYSFIYDERDTKLYPLKGFSLLFDVKKQGLIKADNLNHWQIKGEVDAYVPINAKQTWGVYAMGMTTRPQKSYPYYLSKALGYGANFLRGYEYYVVDGLSMAVLKTKYKYNFFERTIYPGQWTGLSKLKSGVPVKGYLTSALEWGYVNDPLYFQDNPFANRSLNSVSLGLDVLFYYNFIYTMELSMNHLKEIGLFLHYNMRF